MAIATVTNDAIDDLRFVQMFDPDAAFDYGTSTEVSLVSDDGYELVLQGTGFDFNRFDEPTDGTITDIFLYDPSGDLVGRFDQVSYSLEEYYDRVAVDGRPSGFVADLLSGADSATGGSSDDYLEGFGGNDTIAGLGGDDILDGGTGNDRLDGGSGNDQLYGYDGADVLVGGTGNDELYGERGNDRLVGQDGADQLYGGDGADTLDGGVGNDRLEGGNDADRLVGGAGNDTVGGGSGNDVLFGQDGVDRLYGDAGADFLVGGVGADRLTGGSGDDTFRYDSIADRGDVIFDFTRGEDQLEFKASGFTGLTAGFGLVVGADPTAVGSVGSFLFDTDSHRLYYDRDGGGSAGSLYIATLDGVSTLSRSDFDIV